MRNSIFTNNIRQLNYELTEYSIIIKIKCLFKIIYNQNDFQIYNHRFVIKRILQFEYKVLYLKDYKNNMKK